MTPVMLRARATASRTARTRNTTRSGWAAAGVVRAVGAPAPGAADRDGAAADAKVAPDDAAVGEAPRLMDSSCWRRAWASLSRRATSRPPEESAPAIRSRISASPSSRASPVWTTSIAWTWDSGKRSDCRRTRPVSMSSTPPSTRHRVTAQLMTPATKTTSTTARSLTKSCPAWRALRKMRMTSRVAKLVR
jgi:hypothetical protein